MVAICNMSSWKSRSALRDNELKDNTRIDRTVSNPNHQCEPPKRPCNANMLQTTSSKTLNTLKHSHSPIPLPLKNHNHLLAPPPQLLLPTQGIPPHPLLHAHGALTLTHRASHPPNDLAQPRALAQRALRPRLHRGPQKHVLQIRRLPRRAAHPLRGPAVLRQRRAALPALDRRERHARHRRRRRRPVLGVGRLRRRGGGGDGGSGAQRAGHGGGPGERARGRGRRGRGGGARGGRRGGRARRRGGGGRLLGFAGFGRGRGRFGCGGGGGGRGALGGGLRGFGLAAAFGLWLFFCLRGRRVLQYGNDGGFGFWLAVAGPLGPAG